MTAEEEIAHANMAPSVLVASMFETIQRQMEAVGKELKDGRQWMAEAAVAHQKVATGLEGLSAKVEVQNGGVTRALNWMASHDARMASESDIAKGGQMVKDKARSRAEALWGKIEKPVVYGTGLILFGFGLRLGAFFIGGPW